MNRVTFIDKRALLEYDSIVKSFEERVEIVNETH